jgi:dTDP-4-dehydrorhamnose reductase
MLGRALAELFEERFPGAVSATRAEVDITDRFRLEAELERLRPDVIINCAAFTDVDGCETDPDSARRVNAEGAENAARAAAEVGGRLVHISTDFVFDGARGTPYGEADRPAPLSIYGRTKLEGETRIAAVLDDHLIVRSSWLYGAGRSNFVDQIRRRVLAGERLRVVRDQSGSPTWVVDLARAILELLATPHRGIVHFANAGACSRHELAVEIARIVCPAPPSIEPISTDEAGRLAARPANSVLDTTLYTRLTGERPRAWREALRQYLTGGGDPAGAA